MSQSEEEYCPTCNRPLPPKLHVSGPLRRRLVGIVARHPDGVTREALTAMLYTGDERAPNSLSTMVVRANEQLKPQGFRIKASGGWDSRFYLVKLKSELL